MPNHPEVPGWPPQIWIKFYTCMELSKWWPHAKFYSPTPNSYNEGIVFPFSACAATLAFQMFITFIIFMISSWNLQYGLNCTCRVRIWTQICIYGIPMQTGKWSFVHHVMLGFFPVFREPLPPKYYLQTLNVIWFEMCTYRSFTAENNFVN